MGSNDAELDEALRRIQALQTEVWQLRAECDAARAELSRALDALSRATDWGVDMAVTSLAERIGLDSDAEALPRTCDVHAQAARDGAERPEMKPAEVLPDTNKET